MTFPAIPPFNLCYYRYLQTMKYVTMFVFVFLGFLQTVFADTASQTAPDLRQQAAESGKMILIYYHGSDWCESGETAIKVWNSPEFRAPLSSKYLFGQFDSPSLETEAITAANQPAKSLEIDVRQYPAMVMYTSKGEVCGLYNNVPYNVTAQQWTEQINQMNSVWDKANQLKIKAESQTGEEAVNTAAEFFNTLIPQAELGLLRSDKAFKSVWQQMESQDPEDKTGWRRFYNFDFMYYGNKVSDFRNNENIEQGKEFIEQEQNDLRNFRLSTEQKQVLAILPFILNRNKPECQEENIALLKKVVLMDPTTRIGIGAAGWLTELKVESPVVIATVSERMEKEFTAVQPRTEDVFKQVNVSSGEWNPTIVPQTGYTVDFSKQTVAEIQSSDLSKIESLLGTTASANPGQQLAILRAYAFQIIGIENLTNILTNAGSVPFANRFFNDINWLQAFLNSGPINDAAKSYQLLDTLVYQDVVCSSVNKQTGWILGTPIGRTIATALALNNMQTPAENIYAMEAYSRLITAQRLQKDSLNYDTRQWRFIALINWTTALDLLWLNQYVNYKPDRYSGSCWHCSYRGYNFFGDTVQGRMYAMPWSGKYTGSEIANRIGGVCGALSTFGSTTAKVHGVLSVPGGQPGHCAYMYRATNGQWKLAYNIAPFTGTHYTFWGLPFDGLDMIEAIYNNKQLNEAEELFHRARLYQEQKYPDCKLTNLSVQSVEWTKGMLPDFNSVQCSDKKPVSKIAIDDVQQQTNIAIRWQGDLNLNADTEISITLGSDDGSKLIIDGNLCINNDGLHGFINKSESITLTAGKHSVEVQYFNLSGDRKLELSFQRSVQFDNQINALFVAAVQAVPTHYGIINSYAQWLESANAPYEIWVQWAFRTATGLKDYQSPAWRLIDQYFLTKAVRNGGTEELLKQLIELHKIMRQSELPTAEVFNFRAVLDTQFNALENNKQMGMKLFQSVLDVQFNTPNLFGVVLSWGADKFMDDPNLSEQMMTIVSQTFEKDMKPGESWDGMSWSLRGMILKASQSGNITAFVQMSNLLNKITPPAEGALFPTEDFSGKLLSDKGLLQLSSTSGWDTPELYQRVINASAAVDRGFHTNKDTSPWAMITLPGEAEISGIYIEPTRGNGGRNIPLEVWVSDNGTDWTSVFTTDKYSNSWKIDLSKSPIKAKFVKVGRVPENRAEYFHLRKILVYGKPLY